MTDEKRCILVTGGAGYIGSHACKALAGKGYTPVTYDSLVTGHEAAVQWGPFEKGDILDRDRLDELILEYRPSAIMHFAAFASVGESMSDPGKYYRNNVTGSLNLLEAARDHDVERVVLSSTCATYGTPEAPLISEDTPQRPINPYGTSKRMVELLLADFEAAHGIKWASLRYFNAAGADPDNRIGECHDPETHLIPLALDAASGRRSGLTIHGTDYDTADGTCIRDYIHVSDLADAHVLALAALEAGAHSDAYNLGNGRGFSVREVIDCIEKVTGIRVPHKNGPRRRGDPSHLVADASKARQHLGWVPNFPELDEIVSTAWAWHQRLRS